MGCERFYFVCCYNDGIDKAYKAKCKGFKENEIKQMFEFIKKCKKEDLPNIRIDTNWVAGND